MQCSRLSFRQEPSLAQRHRWKFGESPPSSLLSEKTWITESEWGSILRCFLVQSKRYPNKQIVKKKAVYFDRTRHEIVRSNPPFQAREQVTGCKMRCMIRICLSDLFCCVVFGIILWRTPMMYDQECRLERNVGLKSIYTCVPRRVPCTLSGQMPPSLLANEKENI